MNSFPDDPGCFTSNGAEARHSGTAHSYSVFKNSISESGAR